MVKKQKAVVIWDHVGQQDQPFFVIKSNPMMIYENTKGFYYNTTRGRRYVTKRIDGSFYEKIVLK
jgi:hypothetical protein